MPVVSGITGICNEKHGPANFRNIGFVKPCAAVPGSQFVRLYFQSVCVLCSIVLDAVEYFSFLYKWNRYNLTFVQPRMDHTFENNIRVTAR